MKTYEECLAEMEKALSAGSDEQTKAPPTPSELMPDQSDLATIHAVNAETLHLRWELAEQHEAGFVARYLVALAETLRSILLQLAPGGEGYLEEIDADPHFEVVVNGESSLVALSREAVAHDPRLQISGHEIATDVAAQLNINPAESYQLWKRVARACREWAHTPSTPLLMGLELSPMGSSVSIGLGPDDDLGFIPKKSSVLEESQAPFVSEVLVVQRSGDGDIEFMARETTKGGVKR